MGRVYSEQAELVTTVVLNRAEHRNAVDRETAEQLSGEFEAFEKNAESSAAVLYGEGGHFCAGADLKAFVEGKGNRCESEGDGPMGPTRMQMKKPVIAAIEGYAVAGGLELALWCDLRVMAEDAVLGVFCRRFGVPLIDGGTFRLPRIIGLGRALDLILTGRAVRAEEALAMGLVTKIVPSGSARAESEKLARNIAAFPSAAMRADRESAYRQWGMSEEAAIASEFGRGRPALQEGLEGARRFSKGEGRHGKKR